MVTVSAADDPTLPAKSTAVAAMLWIPVDRVLVVIDQFPEPSATPVPSIVAPSNKVTVAPGSDVPLNLGVVSSVMLSLLELPVSLAGSKSGTETVGGVVSIVTCSAAEVVELPAASLALAVMV